jgi:bifunctional non-homologous end joining protein LigD
MARASGRAGARLPAAVAPMLASPDRGRLPEGSEWVYEYKYDGYLTELVKVVRLRTSRCPPATARRASTTPARPQTFGACRAGMLSGEPPMRVRSPAEFR